jgi:hypothetical protein
MLSQASVVLPITSPIAARVRLAIVSWFKVSLPFSCFFFIFLPPFFLYFLYGRKGFLVLFFNKKPREVLAMNLLLVVHLSPKFYPRPQALGPRHKKVE